MKTSVPPYFPFPNFYEEIHREANTCLKKEAFEGIHVDSTYVLGEKFSIRHITSMTAGPTATLSNIFGARYTDSKLMLLAKIANRRLNAAKFKYDFTPNLALKANLQRTDEPRGLINFDYKALDHHIQFHIGSRGLLGATCMVQNVIHPRLSLGLEVFTAPRYTKFDYAHVARYDDGKTIATGHIRGRSGVIALSYVHKVNEKVCLASDFSYDYEFQDIKASFGCCLNIPNSLDVVRTLIKGKIDSNGVVAVLVQHGGGIVSFQFDHNKLDYKIGFVYKS